MTTQQPQTYAEKAESCAELPADTAERFAGYAVLGMPFSSGFYLAFRHFPASSIGPGYRAVWLRRPDGQWVVYADVPPHLSCARYFGSALNAAISAEITVSWNSPGIATIRIPDVLDWRIEMAGSRTSSVVSALAQRIPARLWRNERVLRSMGLVAGPLLHAGKMKFSGVVPNGQSFQAQPLRLWIVRSTTATIDGADAGRPGPLPQQEHLGDFWLPQRGLFVADLGVRFPSTATAGTGAVQLSVCETEERAS
ncbi:hypothetical protein [Arthrobacter sp. A5]|uniref:hypothetical protein n=1 Tax=Arthrobacter sp. A5 TaxID=576926 RepID=UPI003DA9FB4E